jgi:hypothetical protein
MKREVARVVEDRLVEDPRVAHRDDAAGELAALHPHRRVGVLHRRRLAHLHDGRLEEAERDDVAAHAVHDDAVADGEGRAAQDDEVAGERGDDPLQREGQAGGDEADRGDDEAHALARPETEPARAVAGGIDAAEQRERRAAQEPQDHDQSDREQDLVSGDGIA